MSDQCDSTIVMLMVEDNRGDVVFFSEALENTQAKALLHVVGDGDMALQFLRRQPPYADAPRPDVIVLDLNLPIMTGQEVLVEVASDTELNTIPVAILTTSTADKCVCELYPRGRCLYFTKTDDFRRLQDIVRQITTHARTA